MHIDFAPVIEAVLMLCAIAITTFGSWALARLAAHFKIKISTDQQAMFDGALQKALTFGIAQAQATIAAKGWDHADVKNQVVGTALGTMVSKFPDALKAVGLDPNSEPGKIRDALDRAFPAAATVAGASPATPATPALTTAVPVVPVTDPVAKP